MSDMGQDDIDKLLADALGGGGASEDSASAEEIDSGAQSQDEIDALFAQMQDGSESAEEAPPAPEEPAEEEAVDEGVASQDDIDALFAQAAQTDDEPDEPEPEPAPPPGAHAPTEIGVGDQDDIDSLLAGMNGGDESPEEPEPELDNGPQGQDDIDALFAEAAAGAEEPPLDEAEAEPEPEPEPDAGPQGQDDIDVLLAGMGEDDNAPPPEAAEAPVEEPASAEPEPEAEPAAAADDVFAQLTSSTEPPVQQEESSAAPAAEPTPTPAPAPAPMPEAAQPAPAPAPAPAPMPAASTAQTQQQIRSIAESLSLMGSAGEVENIAGQMASLLGQLSERARQYQNTWLSADQEAKELRSRLASSERRVGMLEAELSSLREELTEVRKRSASTEGEKLAADEAHQTEASALRMQLREQESRNQMFASEVKALKEELERTCTEATGADLESRRSRFEVDRLRSEVESERMERLRLQRALENREKEIQAMQAQSAGQASSLFLDELHRLVRRLESQLEARTASAHEAMTLLDKLVVSDDMVPVESNLRAALQAAAGLDEDSNDALGKLSRDAATVRGPAPEDISTATPDEQQIDMVSFETALSSFDLDRAHNIGTALIRNGQSTAARVMERVYRCPALRRPEVAAHLDGLVQILKSLRAIQEQADKRRGQEGPDSNRLYVQMFDFLHNLVRLKLISRSTHDAWGLFLKIRERFTFVTSDRQWADYRDGVLGGEK